ncbi:MAG: glycosyltransferase [Calditrichaceae bacterium]
MDLIYWFFLISNGFYLCLLLLVFAGLRMLKIKNKTNYPKISIVIAARNEEMRIAPAIHSILNLNYPVDKFEVIWVDDASTDNTAKIIERHVKEQKNWKLILLDEKSTSLRGKKKALKSGIDQAKGELIFTTDADCEVPPDWLMIMSSYFDDHTSMVLGHSPLTGLKGFLGRILEFDNLFSAVVTAAPTKLGFPMSSIGRNLSYRKSVYADIGGYDALKKFRSGDDVHLTERFRRKDGGKIDYCAHPATFVSTKPPITRKEIFHQQVRKNSKTLKKSLPSVLLSTVLFFYFIILIIFPFLNSNWLVLWLALLAIKFGAELVTLIKACFIFRKKELIPYLPLMQIVYPGYVIIFSLLGALQIYEWKK